MRMMAAWQTDHPGWSHTVKTSARLSSKAEPSRSEHLKNAWTSANLKPSKAAFLTGLDCEHMCEWMSAFVFLHEKLHGYTFEINVLILRKSLSMKATWSVSVIPSWEGKVREQSVLTKDSVCQANSWAGTDRCTVTPANGMGEHMPLPLSQKRCKYWL